ncbi:DUF393 domain-containing protein [Flavobacteriaceae bacterium]|nr:DUF393 domain-containing protein [Flavobacteriaceae bacterium]
MRRNYILYDGKCGFCNNSVMYIAKNDRENQFTFVSSLSGFGKELLTKNNIVGLEQKTIILIDDKDKVYIKSEAIKSILIKIPKLRIVSYLLLLFPKRLMDYFYMIISKRRKRILKTENCKIPSLEIRQKFILE